MKWHDEFFHERLLPFDRFLFSGRDPVAEGTAIVRWLEVEKESQMLDVCCGWGRQAVPLAKQGYRLSGIDKSVANIREAERRAKQEKVDVDWVVGDVIQMTRIGEFEAAYSIGTAFGYYTEPYEREDLNVEFLRRVHAALKPGGRFLLEQENLPGLDVDYFQTEQARFIRVPSFDPRTRIYSGQYLYQDLRDGGWQINVWRLKLYAGEEIVMMFRSVEFTNVMCYGGFDGSPYTIDSRRLIVVADKPFQ